MRARLAASLSLSLSLAAALAACGGGTHLVDGGPGSDGATADTRTGADGPPIDAGLTPCTKTADKALHFAGAQWADFPDATSLRPTDLTIEAWARFTAAPAGVEAIVAKPYGTFTADSYALWWEGGQLNGGVNPTSVGDAIGVAFQPTVGQWYHLAFTYEHTSSAQALYIDGVQVATGTTTSAPIYDSHPALVGGDIDSGNPQNFFTGDVDEVKLWDAVRDVAGVGLDLHSCTPGTFTGLRAYWPFDEGTGQTTADVSGNGNNGTLGTTTQVETLDPTWIDSTVPF